ncbi:hypothetical protein [Acetobacter sp. LMG 32666]|uniref:hypothetical protein n=1 Tax=Acetobacter sp. LMG 32666 TaxID=2959295 RepID=UPI0030C862B9
MATLTQCLIATLLRMHPKSADAPQGRHAGPVLARAVLSVLAGAAPERAVKGRRGAVAALVATMLPARQTHMERGGGVVPVVRLRGHGRALARMAAGHAPAPYPAPPPEGADGTGAVQAHFLQKVLQVSTPRAVQGQSVPTARVLDAGGAPAPHRPVAQGQAGVWPQHATPPAQTTGAGHKTDASRPAPHPGDIMAGVLPPLPTGAHVLALLLGQAEVGQGHKGAGSGAAHRGRGLRAPARPVWRHAGLMARVLHHGAVGGSVRQGVGLGGAEGAEPDVAPPCAPHYLHATSRAVGVASTVPPLRASPGSTVQAQITVNATSATAQAIGDELAQRMDTLRMQARQANMGQF